MEVKKLEKLIMLIKMMDDCHSEEMSKAHGHLLAEYYDVIEELEALWKENR